MVGDVPKIKMTQYLFNDIKSFDKADDVHLILAFGAQNRINFINLPDQAFRVLRYESSAGT